jgi:protease-4
VTTDIPTAAMVPSPRRGRGRSFWTAWVLFAILLGSVFVNFILLVAVLFEAGGPPQARETLVEGEASARDKILLVPVHGVLIQEPPSPFGANDPVSRTLQALERAEEDEHVKAVVLDIDSPGGGITDCDRLHHRIQRFRKARPGVPLVVSMGDVAASGGYYIAAPADRIFAHRSTITGSIGVIMQLVNVQELTEKKLGIKMDPVTSGPHKDIGSMFRPLTEEERRHFKGMIDAMYEQFLSVVLEGRGKTAQMTREKLLPLADGNVMTGEMAKAGGLVDEIGYLDDAIADARRRASAPEAKVVRYDRLPTLSDILFLRSNAPPPGASAVDQLARLLESGTARMMYLWQP